MIYTPAIILQYWYQALQQEIGIAVKTDDRRWLQRLLYEARQEAKDPELEKIIMMMPGKSDEIFLCKKQVELEP